LELLCLRLLAAAVQTSVKARCPPGLEMTAYILTSGYWPSYPALDAKLPAELIQYQVHSTFQTAAGQSDMACAWVALV
jgi:hypothetical protein